MLLLTPDHHIDYELIDCGRFEKLERFSTVVTVRPEPQAVWEPCFSESEWRKADVRFVQRGSASGDWNKRGNVPDRWPFRYRLANDSMMTLRLALTGFKHVGVFPEQAVNWDYITESISRMGVEKPKFLNLFAYTGAASLAAGAAGAEVTHLDSVKQVVNWAAENQKLSNLSNVRWVVEDALKFAQREVRRGNHYHGIIMDPPAFGHGPEGERWKLDEMIATLTKTVLELLHPDKHFLIVNAYSLGLSAMVLQNLLKPFAGQKLEVGELYLSARSGVVLPLGVFGRFRNF